MQRTILHCDMDAFYASCEIANRPKLMGKPVVVGGDEEARHGIVLTKSYSAKKYGIQTGMTLREARALCNSLIVLPANYGLYIRYSREINKIFCDYTDQVEGFGLDESWLDVTGSGCAGDGLHIAKEIKRRVWAELGITASIGVSYNKIYAKLGSDYCKPNGLVEISPQNREGIVWPLPVKDLLYVGARREARLRNLGIKSIGDLARANVDALHREFGIVGDMLWVNANGYDISRVHKNKEPSAPYKSISNSSTTPRDLRNMYDVHLAMHVLAESIASRLRENYVKCRTVSAYVRSSKLTESISRQRTIKKSTCLTNEIRDVAVALVNEHYSWNEPIRSVGISTSNLESADKAIQLSLFADEDNERVAKREDLAYTLDDIRARYGFRSILPASFLTDPIGGTNPKEDHIMGFGSSAGRF